MVHFKGGWGRVGGRRGGGAGRGGHGEPQLIEIQVLRCRVSQGDSTYSQRREQQRCGDGGVGVWGWGGQPTDNPVKLPADPLGAYGSVSAHMSAGCRVHNQDSFGAIRG